MNFITKYKNYFLISLISLAFGLIRWSFLDREFPLIGWSNLQKKAMKIKELSKQNIGSSIDFSLMKKIVSDEVFPILDARDLESYNEGHIDNAINFDSELLMDGDEENLDKLHKFIQTLSTDRIIVYCWNPDCDRAEILRAFLIDFGISEFNISIYENGWDEWSSFSDELLK
jgi:3-mercaptopyruvate sulfurtransferase SseA